MNDDELDALNWQLHDQLGDLTDDWGTPVVLRSMRYLLLNQRRQETDPNVMNALDRAAARVTEAAAALEQQGI